MIYKCKCETCGKTTIIDTETAKIGPDYRTYVTAYGYLRTRCIYCKNDAFSPWMGFDGRS